MAKINVGIIGCGNIAATMAGTIRRTRGFKAYAAASRDLTKAVGFAKQNGVKKAYGSYEELVNDPKVDLVYIATPHSEHYANAKLCIEHGKACLVEKAFTVNEKQAQELFQLSDEKHVFITEAIWTRYMPFLGTMKDVLASGVIGTPVMLQANLGYAVKGNRRMTDPNLAGGSLLDLSVYPLNFADMLFGDDILRVESTCTYTPKRLDEQDSITIIYRDGRMAVLSTSMLGITDRRGIISGTKGYLEIENINNFEKMTVYNAAYKKVASYKRPRQITGYEYELQACARALENGWTECPEMKHQETLKMMHLYDKIRASFGIVYPFELPQEKPDPLEKIPGATIQDPELAAKKREEAEAEEAAAVQTAAIETETKTPTAQEKAAAAGADADEKKLEIAADPKTGKETLAAGSFTDTSGEVPAEHSVETSDEVSAEVKAEKAGDAAGTDKEAVEGNKEAGESVTEAAASDQEQETAVESAEEGKENDMAAQNPKPGTGGNIYIPYDQRTGNESVVYFTRDLSEKGLEKIYDRISSNLEGKIAVKLHTGEEEGPNIIPRPWVKDLFATRIPDATIVETNTYYEGTRDTTEKHRKTLEVNGWTFCPVDITDENGVATLPVHGGKWFDEMHVGKDLLNYDSLLVLTHFKGHAMGGFGGSNKNIGIGCADGKIGKKEIHTYAGSDNMWSIGQEEFMERMTESCHATVDHFAPHISFINVMRNMSVSCDCEGPGAEPVVTPDVGILASLDILAVDQACIDIVYSMPDHAGKHLVERIESRHGLRQLSYMKELGMGNDRYHILDIDNGDNEITAAEACSFVKPGWIPDKYNTFKGRNNL